MISRGRKYPYQSIGTQAGTREMRFEITSYPHMPRIFALSWLLGYGEPGMPSRRAGICMQIWTKYIRWYWRNPDFN